MKIVIFLNFKLFQIFFKALLKISNPFSFSYEKNLFVSLFSYISGITILGFPAEMYVYGTQLWCVVIADSFVSLTMAVVYLPVFYDLGITSSYEVTH